MKHKQKIATGLLSVTFIAGCSSQPAEQQPNVIYIFPDQFRNAALNFWREKGFTEHVNFKPDPVHTPNLDNFAKESVVFTSAQSNCPLSSPHRGMLMTGMYPDGSGVTLNCNETRPCSQLKQEATTISDVFSANGYDCAYIGKLHLDFPTKNNPQNPGTYVESRKTVWDKSPHYWDTDSKRHEIREWSPKHEADKAIDYLKNQRDKKKPFFLMIAMNPPHSPYRSLDDVEEKDYNLYKDIPLNKLLIRPNVNPELKDKQKSAPYYFASVTGVDREFGRILKALKEMNLENNTIVVFSSDHGETMASHLLDPKNSPYTESMNIPFIVRYPKKLKPSVTSMLLSTPDVMPTLLSLAGLKNEIPKMVQGNDLSTLLLENDKEKFPKGALYIKNLNGKRDKDNKVIDYFAQARGIKTDQYTLAIYINKKKKVKKVLFFDDQKDPYQMNNLDIKTHQKELKSLLAQMEELLKKADDPWYRENTIKDVIQQVCTK